MLVMRRKVKCEHLWACLKFGVLKATDNTSMCFYWAGRESPLLGSSRAAGPLSGPGPGDDSLQPPGLS